MNWVIFILVKSLANVGQKKKSLANEHSWYVVLVKCGSWHFVAGEECDVPNEIESLDQ